MADTMDDVEARGNDSTASTERRKGGGFVGEGEEGREREGEQEGKQEVELVNGMEVASLNVGCGRGKTTEVGNVPGGISNLRNDDASKNKNGSVEHALTKAERGGGGGGGGRGDGGDKKGISYLIRRNRVYICNTIGSTFAAFAFIGFDFFMIKVPWSIFIPLEGHFFVLLF